ncbi:hypothetical protein GCM10018965_058850 [Nonomuraea roseola]
MGAAPICAGSTPSTAPLRHVLLYGHQIAAKIDKRLVRDHGHTLAIGRIQWHTPETQKTCISAGQRALHKVDRVCPL